MPSRISEVAAFDGSFAALILGELIDQVGLEETHRLIDSMLDTFSNVELVAHEFDWSIWSRSKQRPPEGDFLSWGDLGARGMGKTLSKSKFVNEEVMAGRSKSICLLAQDEDNAVKLMVTGPSGLIATAPPWFKPEWRVSELVLVWPNGSRAYVRTPEVPDKIRGFDYDLAWLSEIQSWPAAHRDAAWMNVLVATRIGKPRICWDATPRCRHPLLRKLLKYGEDDPSSHVVVRGTTYENVLNLGAGYIEKMETELGGSQQGREELLGIMLDDAEGATAKAEWIETSRRPMPDKFVRKVLGVDVAVTSSTGSDQTGIILAGIAVDGQCCVLKDLTGKYRPDEWAKVVLDTYVNEGCDCVAIETNKGHDLVTYTLRVNSTERGLQVIVLGKEERPRRVPGVVYVREVFARGDKADRAKPVGTAYERQRISHVIGQNLIELENTLTTWVPGGRGDRSPDRLDALTHAVTELLGLASNKADPKVGFVGLAEINRAVQQPTRQTARSISSLGSGGHDPGGRI